MEDINNIEFQKQLMRNFLNQVASQEDADTAVRPTQQRVQANNTDAISKLRAAGERAAVDQVQQTLPVYKLDNEISSGLFGDRQSAFNTRMAIHGQKLRNDAYASVRPTMSGASMDELTTDDLAIDYSPTRLYRDKMKNNLEGTFITPNAPAYQQQDVYQNSMQGMKELEALGIGLNQLFDTEPIYQPRNINELKAKTPKATQTPQNAQWFRSKGRYEPQYSTRNSVPNRPALTSSTQHTMTHDGNAFRTGYGYSFQPKRSNPVTSKRPARVGSLSNPANPNRALPPHQGQANVVSLGNNKTQADLVKDIGQKGLLSLISKLGGGSVPFISALLSPVNTYSATSPFVDDNIEIPDYFEF